jgi:hypothetical protein
VGRFPELGQLGGIGAQLAFAVYGRECAHRGERY